MMKKLLSFMLAVVMIFSLLPTSVFALTQDDENSFTVNNATVEVDGTEDKTVTIVFAGTEADVYTLISGEFPTADESGNIQLSNLEAGYITDDLSNFAHTATGEFKLSQASSGVSFDEMETIVTATYTVSKDTPAGKYNVDIYVNTAENYSWEYIEEVTYTAEITVTRAGESEEETITEFEVYYEIVGTDSEPKDNFVEVNPGANVEIGVYVKAKEGSSIKKMQAFDIYPEWEEMLSFVSASTPSGRRCCPL